MPITQTLSGWRIPEGIRWNLNFSPSRTIVWPALLPPWKRTIDVGAVGEQVDDFPLPSSPHWAPTMTRPGMTAEIVPGSTRPTARACVAAVGGRTAAAGRRTISIRRETVREPIWSSAPCDLRRCPSASALLVTSIERWFS